MHRKTIDPSTWLRGLAALPALVFVLLLPQLGRAENKAYIDYAKVMQPASPLLFGTCQRPNRGHTDAWDKFASFGGNLVRESGIPFPRDIRLDDYKNNVRNVQDPATWNWANSDGWIAQARQRGIKVMLLYWSKPQWLTHDGSKAGIINDWDVYQDLTKKWVAHYQDKIDYIEIFNEPWDDKYFTFAGSSYKSREAAVADQFYHAAAAIRQVNKRIPIAVATDEINSKTFPMLTALLTDKRITKDMLNVVCPHSYGRRNFNDVRRIREILKAHGREDVQTILSEWGIGYGAETPESVGQEGISYHGNMFISAWQHGIDGLGLYSGFPRFSSAPYDVIGEPDAGGWEEKSGIYLWNKNTNTATYNLHMRTWLIWAKTAGLGRGTSSVVSTRMVEAVDAMGAPATDKPPVALGMLNPSGAPVALASNHSAKPAKVIFKLANLPWSGAVSVKVFLASATNDGTAPVRELTVNLTGDTLAIPVELPAYSTCALIFGATGTPQAAAPTFTPPATTYAKPQTVTLTAAVQGATIRYTTDGTDPSPTNGTVYTEPISVTQNTTIKAIAYRDGLKESNIASGSFVIDRRIRFPKEIAVTTLGVDVTDADVPATLRYAEPHLVASPFQMLLPDERPAYLMADPVISYADPATVQAQSQPNWSVGGFRKSTMAGINWKNVQYAGMLVGTHDKVPVIAGTTRLVPNANGIARVAIVLHGGTKATNYVLQSIS